MHAIARNNKYLLFLRFRAFLDMSLDCTCSSESQQNTTKLLGNTGFMKLSITAMCHSQEVSKGCCCYLFFFLRGGGGCQRLQAIVPRVFHIQNVLSQLRIFSFVDSFVVYKKVSKVLIWISPRSVFLGLCTLPMHFWCENFFLFSFPLGQCSYRCHIKSNMCLLATWKFSVLENQRLPACAKWIWCKEDNMQVWPFDHICVTYGSLWLKRKSVLSEDTQS